MKRLRALVENRWLSVAIVFAIGVALRTIRLADVPAGIFHDEAWSAVKALAILNGDTSPQVYFAENNGMDAAHVYGIAALFALTGPLAIGSRIVSSLAGSLTILATYWAAWELFAEEQWRHGLSLLAAFVVATLFVAVATSRSGWHAASMTLVVTLSLAALFRGRRLRRRRWFVAAGLLAGLAQYTYPSARFLPALLALIGTIDILTNHPLWRAILVDYLSLFVAAAIVFAPLGVYFIQNPASIFVRAQQTTETSPADLGQNILKTLAGFSITGDTEGMHNLPGRPMLDPILSVFFVAGLAVCVIRRQAAHPSTALPAPSGRGPPHTAGEGRLRRAGLILIAWLIVFTLPVVLTGQAPLSRRWTGVLPAAAMLIAIGAAAVAQMWQAPACSGRGQARLAASPLRPLVIAALLAASAALGMADYFGPYAARPEMFWGYDAGLTRIANTIRAKPDTTVFLTPTDRFYEVVAITLAEARRAPIQSYNGEACAVFPETTSRETEWVVVTEQDDRTLPLMQRLFPAGEIVWQIDSPAGVYARALRVPAGQMARLELARRQRADLGGKVRLIGYDLPQSVEAGATLRATVALEGVSTLEQPYKVFVHVRDAGDAVLAQSDRLPCNFTLNEADWRPGDIVLETYEIPIPAGAPRGEYRVMLGVYEAESGARLPVLESELDHTGDSVLLGMLEVE
jgi:4-amino-4-deoxy-L-arabinose transferase-like glycosyltransferase